MIVGWVLVTVGSPFDVGGFSVVVHLHSGFSARGSMARSSVTAAAVGVFIVAAGSVHFFPGHGSRYVGVIHCIRSEVGGAGVGEVGVIGRVHCSSGCGMFELVGVHCVGSEVGGVGVHGLVHGEALSWVILRPSDPPAFCEAVVRGCARSYAVWVGARRVLGGVSEGVEIVLQLIEAVGHIGSGMTACGVVEAGSVLFSYQSGDFAVGHQSGDFAVEVSVGFTLAGEVLLECEHSLVCFRGLRL